MLNQFQYTFLEHADIIKYLSFWSDTNILLNFVIFATLFVLIIASSYSLIPHFYNWEEKRKMKKIKRHKTQLLKQIILQKEIEDEVEQEIKESEKMK